MSDFVADMIIQRVISEMQGCSRIVERLQKKGYSEIFESSNNQLKCLTNNHYYMLNDFDIEELYNLEYVCGIGGLFLYAVHHRLEG